MALLAVKPEMLYISKQLVVKVLIGSQWVTCAKQGLRPPWSPETKPPAQRTGRSRAGKTPSAMAAWPPPNTTLPTERENFLQPVHVLRHRQRRLLLFL